MSRCIPVAKVRREWGCSKEKPCGKRNCPACQLAEFMGRFIFDWEAVMSDLENAVHHADYDTTSEELRCRVIEYLGGKA